MQGLMFLVAAGAKETTTGVGFAGYTYMQDIDEEKCNSIIDETEGRLIDKRDNKVYWVAKLKDGLCWMTQNLDYDGGAVEGYNGDDIATLEAADASTKFDSSTTSRMLYYDPGEYVYLKAPAALNNCNNLSFAVGLAGCTNWINVNTLNTTWYSTSDPNFMSATSYPSADGRETCQKAAGSWTGDATGQYIYCNFYYAPVMSHYLIGNYYNWKGATNGSSASSGSIGTSVCPTGWSLPISNSNATPGSFGKLLSGLTYAQVAVAPYYFVFGGNASDNIINSSYDGSYWSATANSTNNAYFLYIADTGVNPSKSNSRYSGFSVRCVAR